MLWPASGASRARLTGDLAVKIAGHRSTQQCLRTPAPTTTSGRAERNTAQRGHTAVRAPAEHRGGSPPVIPTDVRGNQRTSRRPGFGQRAPFEHRNVHMRPTKDLVDRMCAGQGPATGAPPGTRTPNSRIKSPNPAMPARSSACRLMTFPHASGGSHGRGVSAGVGYLRGHRAPMEHRDR